MPRYRQREPLFPPSLLKRLFCQSLTLKKTTWTGTTAKMGASQATYKEYKIDGNIQPITDEAVVIGLGGEQNVAVGIGYVRTSYFIEGEEVTVQSDDLLVSEDGQDIWRVLSTVRQFGDRRDAGYRLCTLQKIEQVPT